MIYPNFKIAISSVRNKFLNTSQVIRTEKWQGITLDHDMKESLNISFQCFMSNDLKDLQYEIKPNLPWADLHFEERVGGIPTNPGDTYMIWPYYKMDDKMRNMDHRFTHTYMERIWPKGAGKSGMVIQPHRGIYFEYGDFKDVIKLLHREPFTRQAFLPIWFPEDTGVVHGGRVPCSLGYHFIRRDNYLHVVYYIRSCDYLRHFRDDIYLTVRKVMWLIEQIQQRPMINNDNWERVKPGILTMHITSLHCFVSDIYAIEKEIKNENK